MRSSLPSSRGWRPCFYLLISGEAGFIFFAGIIIGLAAVVFVTVAAIAVRPAREADVERVVVDDRPRYMISVAADLVGMHPQTLRIYETKGLVQPQRTAGNTRLYSEADLERLRLINQLTTELGLNLAGVEHVIRLEEQLRRMQRRMERLELEMRERLEEMRRSYSADLVPYDPDATRLPIRRTWTSTG